MKGKFFDVTTMLADFAGMTNSCQMGDSVASLYNDAVLLHLMLDEQGKSAVMQVVVGIAPCHNKDVLYATLLQWNHNFAKSHGFSYALLDTGSAEIDIILQGAIALTVQDDVYAQNVFSQFIEEYADALEHVDTYLQDLALSV